MARRIVALFVGGLMAVAFVVPAQADFGTTSVPCGDGSVSVTPNNLWPPNHKMRTVTLSFEETGTPPAVNNGNIIQLTVNSITYDEAGREHGRFAHDNPDYSGVGSQDLGFDTVDGSDPATVTIKLRSERFGHDMDGRQYTIDLTCADLGSGVTGTPYPDDGPTSQSVDLTVTVPHDRGH